MKIFELHFNPKKAEDRIFDSFVFEPENSSEKPLGNLYMIGEFAKILPQNSKFLNGLSQVVKKEYFLKGKLTEALKRANEFLDKEARSGNVNWLGNLHFSVLSLAPYKNLWAMNFSKAGEMKILLSRGEELLDIGQNLEMREIEPYPLKIFGNVVTGKVAPHDKILLLTKDLFSLLSQKGSFLNQLRSVSDEKELKKLLKINEKLLSGAVGICLLLIVPERATKHSSAKIFKRPAIKLPGIKFPVLKIKLPFPNLLQKKSAKLIIILLLVLLAGSLIFGSRQKEEKQEEKKEQQQEQEEQKEEGSVSPDLLQSVADKIEKANEYLSLGNTKKATELLKEAQGIISEFEGEEAASLQKKIQEFLEIINGG